MYILEAKRSAIGKFNGSLSSLKASQIASHLIKYIKDKYSLQKVDEIIIGNVLQANQGQNPARQAGIYAGFDVSVPAFTVNKVCGSGLKSVMLAVNSILAEENELVIAGGTENMSQAPYYLDKARNGYRLGDGILIDSLVSDGLTCPFNKVHMGVLADKLAKEYNISRDKQDEYAFNSHKKAAKAQEQGLFNNEIIPIPIKIKKEVVEFKKDEVIRPNTSLEKMAKLPPVFTKDGTTTAGNASAISDGASVLLIANEKKSQELGIKPIAKIIAYTTVFTDPAYYLLAPIEGINKLLEKVKMTLNDIDLIELNEAFSVQPIIISEKMNLDLQKVNVWGGAVALGHPIGASGARILTTLISQLKYYNKEYGIASLCIGTGGAVSMLVKNIN